ncbi:MAG TPA: DUF2480 family protein [Cyclobacteriaceae bacterium]|nr:DUF2480 family protein [Cyclobacteriaceae bacterium]
MEQDNEIINRVSNSALITFDLETYYQEGDRVLLDIKDQLYEGLILKEKDFREFIKSNNWSSYQDKLVAVTCSTDAILPTWAFMLIAIALRPYAKRVELGSLDDLEEILFRETLSKVNWEQFRDAKVIVKGCSKVNVPPSAYVFTVSRLQPIVSSLMFGEACSTVPLYKRKAN